MSKKSSPKRKWLHKFVKKPPQVKKEFSDDSLDDSDDSGQGFSRRRRYGSHRRDILSNTSFLYSDSKRRSGSLLFESKKVGSPHSLSGASEDDAEEDVVSWAINRMAQWAPRWGCMRKRRAVRRYFPVTLRRRASELSEAGRRGWRAFTCLGSMVPSLRAVWGLPKRNRATRYIRFGRNRYRWNESKEEAPCAGPSPGFFQLPLSSAAQLLIFFTGVAALALWWWTCLYLVSEGLMELPPL